ncbi:hypothetical protein MRX96_004428 [Rhipicephalus microplus]
MRKRKNKIVLVCLLLREPRLSQSGASPGGSYLGQQSARANSQARCALRVAGFSLVPNAPSCVRRPLNILEDDASHTPTTTHYPVILHDRSVNAHSQTAAARDRMRSMPTPSGQELAAPSVAQVVKTGKSTRGLRPDPVRAKIVRSRGGASFGEEGASRRVLARAAAMQRRPNNGGRPPESAR